MSLQDTQFIQRQAAKMAADMLTDERIAERLHGVPDPETKRRILHEKAASTFLGWMFVVLGVVLIFGDLVGFAIAFRYKWVSDQTAPLFLGILLSPAGLGVVFLVIGGANISNELRKTLGWFPTLVKSLVAIFRKLPNEPAPPAA